MGRHRSSPCACDRKNSTLAVDDCAAEGWPGSLARCWKWLRSGSAPLPRPRPLSGPRIGRAPPHAPTGRDHQLAVDVLWPISPSLTATRCVPFDDFMRLVGSLPARRTALDGELRRTVPTRTTRTTVPSFDAVRNPVRSGRRAQSASARGIFTERQEWFPTLILVRVWISESLPNPVGGGRPRGS
jgi:hypothetical protein